MSKLQRLESFLLFLILLFLPTQLGRHFWPEFSYIFSLKVDYLSPTVYFWDLLVMALVIIWKINKGRVNKLALNLWLLFILSQVISLFAAKNVGAGLVRAEQFMLAGLFGVYLASKNWQDLKQKLFWPLILGVAFESFLAMGQFLKGGTLGFWILGERSFSLSTPAIAKFDFYGLEFLRPYATFPHPNVLAGYLLVLIFSFQFLIFNFWKKRKMLFRLVAFLASAAIVLTVSRVAILLGFILSLVVLPKKWKMVLILAALVLSPIVFTRFEALFSFDNLTLLRREQLAEDAWRMFLSSPIFGVGLNNFIPAQAESLILGPSRFLQPVHNIFLLALAETGIIGLIGLIGLIGYPVFKLYSSRFPLTALLPWVAIFFLGLFDHYFLTLPQGYRLLFMLWGLSLSSLKFK